MGKSKTSDSILAYCRLKFQDDNLIWDETDFFIVQSSDFSSDFSAYPENFELAQECLNCIINDQSFFEFNHRNFEILEYKLYKEDYLNKRYKKNRILDFTKTENHKITIYVYYAPIKCQLKNHSIECVSAKAEDLNTGDVNFINVQYCEKCNIYFINSESLKIYIKQDISIGANFKKMPEYRYVNETFPRDILNDFSPLSLNGYSTKLPHNIRLQTLSKIISRGYVSKNIVIMYLEQFIHRNGASVNNERALSIWQKDLLFVNSYNFEEQRLISGTIDYRIID